MIKLIDLIKESLTGLDYIQSIQSDEPFDTSQPLYHLALESNLDNIMREGLKPTMPKAGIHGGKVKGEAFAGVWLSSMDDPGAIVDIHMLPRKYEYQGIVLQIDASKLDPKLFSLENEVIEMKNDIKELKRSIKELIEMIKAVYDFEDA